MNEHGGRYDRYENEGNSAAADVTGATDTGASTPAVTEVVEEPVHEDAEGGGEDNGGEDEEEEDGA